MLVSPGNSWWFFCAFLAVIVIAQENRICNKKIIETKGKGWERYE